MRDRCTSVLLAVVIALALAGCGGVSGTSSATSDSPAGASPIRNIVVAIMQNRSFDHLFGQYPGVDGIRTGVPGYTQTDAEGVTVSPARLDESATVDLPHGRDEYLRVWNSGRMDRYAFHNGPVSLGYHDGDTPGVDRLWQWARQYALSDRFFASVMGSAPSNQLFLTAASDKDFPYGVQPFYGPCVTDEVTAPAFSFRNIGDQLTQAGVTWAWYHEGLGDCAGGYSAVQNPFQYFAATHDSPNVRDYSEFEEALENDSLPSVAFVQPGPENSTHPSGGPVTNGLMWLDNLLTRIQASSPWSGVAVIVVWDESGGWWDHVPPPQVDGEGYGMRVPLLVVSPHAKRNYVSHVEMDHVSILKSIQTNWNLPPLNGRNDSASALNDMFAF